MTTTFAAIRDQQVTLIKALTPTRHSTELFTLYPGEMEFLEWCGANPQACFRCFTIESNFDAIRPLVSNTDVVDTEQTMTLAVAYPMDFGRVGPENQRELEDLIEEDKWKIDQAVGLHGYPNYLAGQHLCELTSAVLTRIERVFLLVLQYRVVFRRTAT